MNFINTFNNFWALSVKFSIECLNASFWPYDTNFCSLIDWKKSWISFTTYFLSLPILNDNNTTSSSLLSLPQPIIQRVKVNLLLIINLIDHIL